MTCSAATTLLLGGSVLRLIDFCITQLLLGERGGRAVSRVFIAAGCSARGNAGCSERGKRSAVFCGDDNPARGKPAVVLLTARVKRADMFCGDDVAARGKSQMNR